MMTKLSRKPLILAVLVALLALKLKNNSDLVFAEPQLHHDTKSFPGRYVWSSAKDLNEPLTFVGTGSKSLNSAGSLKGNTILGSITYGEGGKWIGKAIPLSNGPLTTVVSTSLAVHGEEPQNDRRIPTRGRPRRPPFNNIPFNGAFPFGRPNPHHPFVPHFHPFISQHFSPVFNQFIPVGRVRNRPYSNRNIKYREVDPSYLILGKNSGRGTGMRAYLRYNKAAPVRLPSSLQSENIRNKRKNKPEDLETVEDSGPQLAKTLDSQLDAVPSNQYFSVLTQSVSEPKSISVSPETVTTNPGVLAHQRSATTKFVPIIFLKTTPKPEGTASFSTFTRKPTKTPAPFFDPTKFIFNITKPVTEPTNSITEETDTLPEEIEIDDIDRVISDIIRIIPATRRVNSTSQKEITRPSRIPDSNAELFPGLGKPFPPPPRFPEANLPPRPDTEVDDEGWTIIGPKFKGTIIRTPFENPPGIGRHPNTSPDVEILPFGPSNERRNPVVIDKSLVSDSTETKIHKEITGSEEMENYFENAGNASPKIVYLSFTTLISTIMILSFLNIIIF